MTAVILAVLLLIALEGALRVVAPIDDPYERLKSPANPYIPSAHPARFEAAVLVGDDIAGVDRAGVFRTNNVGLRGDDLGTPKPEGERRLFLVGDSVVECMFLDDGKALPRALEVALGAHARDVGWKVYGAGRSRDKSDDLVALVTQRLLHLEPDAIVLCSAVNDLMASLAQHDYAHLRLPAAPRLSAAKLARMAATESQIGRRIVCAVGGIEPQRATARTVLQSKNRARVERRRAAPRAQTPPRANVDAYRRNLLTIVASARANGVSVVLMTQPCTWATPSDDMGVAAAEWRLQRGGVTYPRDLMAAEMARLNDTTRAIARSEGAALYDAERSLPMTREYLYDDIHLTIEGVRRVAAELAAIVAAAPASQASGGRGSAQAYR